VWVTFPKTVRDGLDVLWLIAGVFSSRSAALRIETLEVTVDWCESSLSTLQPVRYFCPIWMEAGAPDRMWWMTFNRQTYASDVLRLAGGQNVFADRTRLYPLSADLGESSPEDPGERDIRYPRLPLEEIRLANPDMILLPSEPFPFGEAESQQVCELLADTRAVQDGRVYRVDGSLITWHGTRLARALQQLPELFSIK
jgi:ABC-type Fe3+-hydroxamate transport system substrate-binding protein